MTNGSLMKVESIAECSLGAFCNTFDLHQAIIGLESQFLVIFEWPLKTGVCKFAIFTTDFEHFWIIPTYMSLICERKNIL